MGNSACELADGFHFLGMTKLRFGFDPAGDFSFQRSGALAHAPFQLPVQLRKRRFPGFPFRNVDVDPAVSDGLAVGVANQAAAAENPADLAVTRPADAVFHLERLGVVAEDITKTFRYLLAILGQTQT